LFVTLLVDQGRRLDGVFVMVMNRDQMRVQKMQLRKINLVIQEDVHIGQNGVPGLVVLNRVIKVRLIIRI